MFQSIHWTCPSHKTELVKELHQFDCQSGCSFSIVGGIPRFVENHYAEAFGFQWKKFANTQIDSFSGVPASRTRIQEACTVTVLESMRNKMVLEIGCGAGRFTELLLETGAFVVSTDLSKAVEANQLNFPINDRHLIIQSDVNTSPFRPAQFDFVICLGVIQHTPNPEETLESLVAELKPGGQVIIDHYAKSVKWFLSTAPLFRFFLKKLKPEVSFRLVQIIYSTSISFFKKSSKRITRKFLYAIFPIVFFDNEFEGLTAEQKYEWGLLDTYDRLTDKYKHRRTPNQINAKFVKLGLEKVLTWKGGNAVISRGTKPIKC